MTDDTVGGIGSLKEPSEERERLARASLEYNCAHPLFAELFPELMLRDGGATPPPTHPAVDSIAQSFVAGPRPGNLRPSSPKELEPSGLPSPVTPHVSDAHSAFQLPPEAGPCAIPTSPHPRSLQRILSTNEYNWHRAAQNGRAEELRKIAADGVDFCAVDPHGRNAVSKVSIAQSTDALYLLLEAGVPHLHHGPLMAYRRHHVGVLHPLKGLLEDIAFHGAITERTAAWASQRSVLRTRLAARLERPMAGSPPPLPPLTPGAAAPKLIQTLVRTLKTEGDQRLRVLAALCALADQSLSGPRRAIVVMEESAMTAIVTVMQQHEDVMEIVYHGTLAIYETVLKVQELSLFSSVLGMACHLYHLCLTLSRLPPYPLGQRHAFSCHHQPPFPAWSHAHCSPLSPGSCPHAD
jgi:hypothetical protein